MQPDRTAPLTVALYQPVIPQNTATILRMWAKAVDQPFGAK
jgi:tRNA(Leu) C34 or U34 (ribose-2'-O)-methylase TrmL